MRTSQICWLFLSSVLISLVLQTEAQPGLGSAASQSSSLSAASGLFSLPLPQIVLGLGMTGLKLSVAGRLLGLISDWFVNRGPTGVKVYKEFVDVPDYETTTMKTKSKVDNFYDSAWDPWENYDNLPAKSKYDGWKSEGNIQQLPLEDEPKKPPRNGGSKGTKNRRPYPRPAPYANVPRYYALPKPIPIPPPESQEESDTSQKGSYDVPLPVKNNNNYKHSKTPQTEDTPEEVPESSTHSTEDSFSPAPVQSNSRQDPYINGVAPHPINYPPIQMETSHQFRPSLMQRLPMQFPAASNGYQPGYPILFPPHLTPSYYQQPQRQQVPQPPYQQPAAMYNVPQYHWLYQQQLSPQPAQASIEQQYTNGRSESQTEAHEQDNSFEKSNSAQKNKSAQWLYQQPLSDLGPQQNKNDSLKDILDNYDHENTKPLSNSSDVQKEWHDIVDKYTAENNSSDADSDHKNFTRESSELKAETPTPSEYAIEENQNTAINQNEMLSDSTSRGNETSRSKRYATSESLSAGQSIFREGMAQGRTHGRNKCILKMVCYMAANQKPPSSYSHYPTTVYNFFRNVREQYLSFDRLYTMLQRMGLTKSKERETDGKQSASGPEISADSPLDKATTVLSSHKTISTTESSSESLPAFPRQPSNEHETTTRLEPTNTESSHDHESTIIPSTLQPETTSNTATEEATTVTAENKRSQYQSEPTTLPGSQDYHTTQVLSNKYNHEENAIDGFSTERPTLIVQTINGGEPVNTEVDLDITENLARDAFDHGRTHGWDGCQIRYNTCPMNVINIVMLASNLQMEGF